MASVRGCPGPFCPISDRFGVWLALLGFPIFSLFSRQATSHTIGPFGSIVEGTMALSSSHTVLWTRRRRPKRRGKCYPKAGHLLVTGPPCPPTLPIRSQHPSTPSPFRDCQQALDHKNCAWNVQYMTHASAPKGKVELSLPRPSIATTSSMSHDQTLSLLW